MRVCKSQCSLFKEMYAALINKQVDAENKAWMEQHKKECSYCNEWCKSVDENREDIIDIHINEEHADDSIMKDAKRAKVFVTIGMGFMLFLAVWLSSN